MSDNGHATTVAQCRSAKAFSSVRKQYDRFGGQYIGGVWRHGQERSKLIDTDPYTGQTLTEIVQANSDDLDARTNGWVVFPTTCWAATPVGWSVGRPQPEH